MEKCPAATRASGTEIPRLEQELAQAAERREVLAVELKQKEKEAKEEAVEIVADRESREKAFAKLAESEPPGGAQ